MRVASRFCSALCPATSSRRSGNCAGDRIHQRVDGRIDSGAIDQRDGGSVLHQFIGERLRGLHDADFDAAGDQFLHGAAEGRVIGQRNEYAWRRLALPAPILPGSGIHTISIRIGGHGQFSSAFRGLYGLVRTVQPCADGESPICEVRRLPLPATEDWIMNVMLRRAVRRWARLLLRCRAAGSGAAGVPGTGRQRQFQPASRGGGIPGSGGLRGRAGHCTRHPSGAPGPAAQAPAR